jgi:hypothetical protein
VLGYGGRVLPESVADPGTESAPVFDDWGELFVGGLKQFAVVFVYLLVPALVAGASVGGMVLAALTGRGGSAPGPSAARSADSCSPPCCSWSRTTSCRRP